MLDAIAKDAAVFEPKEVEVLTAAYTMALKKCGVGRHADAAEKTELACLVHNLGRSRLRLGKSLLTQTDAIKLADEASDVMGYLKHAPQIRIDDAKSGRCVDRDVTIFPTDLRALPTSAFRKI